MSDAIGGVVNIALVVFFMVVIALYMAYNVNYEKAFNVKNRIIDLYEEYDGSCLEECRAKIKEYEQSVGYENSSAMHKVENKDDNYHCFHDLGYCVKGVKNTVKAYAAENPHEMRCYFEVKTFVTINIPFITNILGNYDIFQPTGQTKNIDIITRYTTKSCTDIAIAGG